MSKFANKYNGGAKLEWFTKELEPLKLKDVLDVTLHFTNFGKIRVENAKTKKKEDRYVMTVFEKPDKFIFANEIIGEVLDTIVAEGDYAEACSASAPFQFHERVSGNGNPYFCIEFAD